MFEFCPVFGKLVAEYFVDRYFEYHSCPTKRDISDKTHGIVPVWGFGTVVESTHPKVVKGERIYGYLAPCRYIVAPVSPSDVNKHAFYIPRPHLPGGMLFNYDIVLLWC
jgi:hypothetical protein